MEPLSPLLGGGVLFLAMLVLLMAGIHIVIVLGLSSLAFLGLFYGGWDAIAVIAPKTISTLDSFTLAAIPLFLIMGEFIFHGRIGEDLFNATERWMGFVPRGLSVATIASCAVFAAVSGSSTATAATIGSAAIPEMRRHGYPLRLAAGTVAAGGGLGILIPPSISMIMYGSITGTSIGHLFMAGFVPGALIAFMLMLYIILFEASEHIATKPSVSWHEKFQSLKGVWAPGLLIVVVLGGIYLGIMTPTEAAGVGATMALLVTIRRLKWASFTDSLISAGQTSCMILMIIASATIFGYVLSLLRFPQELAFTIIDLEVPRWFIIIFIVLVLLVLGCVMSGTAILVITLPIFFPLAMELGFDAIWFGVVYTVSMEIGMITPPIGMNLFVVTGLITEEGSLIDVIMGTFPFVFVYMLGLAIIMAFPAISLFLPRFM